MHMSYCFSRFGAYSLSFRPWAADSDYEANVVSSGVGVNVVLPGWQRVEALSALSGEDSLPYEDSWAGCPRKIKAARSKAGSTDDNVQPHLALDRATACVLALERTGMNQLEHRVCTVILALPLADHLSAQP